ncbi:DUF1906 domain-containing protein [Streptomyces triticagri]|uniref:DUF1906 domain-containing protein n=2 Tax=Streptomyces triticagri TaxID=2293568 RepID=A0A372LW51_9ACTN|nr:DUF1906 domain-containing protein [Streptomyces triticagri]
MRPALKRVLLPVAALLSLALAAPPAAAADPGQEQALAEVYRGWAFDTCDAPSVATMSAWRSSDYGAVGIYFGGRGRHCQKQPNLDRSWVRSVDGQGWGLLPLYVGSQSPCVHAKNKQDVRITGDPATRGATEGRDAVGRAQQLGIQPRSPLYLDMEGYDIKNKACADKTLAFVRAWNREVRSQGYLPGFYSSADSGVTHMQQAQRAGVGDLPEVMWFARWNTPPNLYGEPALDQGAWFPHRRIHQYRGNSKEAYGGHTLTVDRNLMEAPVARVVV